MNYEGAIYRPPSEAESLILQISVGCSHNRCTFCSMYKDKTFRVKTPAEIEASITYGLQQYPFARRIFLADGDALSIGTEQLAGILDTLYERFSRLERVGIYGGPKGILQKSTTELSALRQHGLGIVYQGVESGSAKVLTRVNKGVTPGEMIEAGQRVIASGLSLSCTVILGLGGKELSDEHAEETARVINAINPPYLAALTLMLAPGAPLLRLVEQGKFQLQTRWESLEELRKMITMLQVEHCVFRSNHASNYLPLRAQLPDEKEALLKILTEVIEERRAERLRPDFFRGL